MQADGDDPMPMDAIASQDGASIAAQAWRMNSPALEAAAESLHDVILAIADNSPLQLRLAVDRAYVALLLIQDRFDQARLAQIRDDLSIQHCRWWWREDGTVHGKNARDSDMATVPLGRLTDLRDELHRAARMPWESAIRAADGEATTTSFSAPTHRADGSGRFAREQRKAAGPMLLARAIMQIRDQWRADKLDDYAAAHQAGLIVEAAVRAELQFCDQLLVDLIRDALAGRIKNQELEGPYTKQAHAFIAAAHGLICQKYYSCPDFSIGSVKYFEHGCRLLAQAVEASREVTKPADPSGDGFGLSTEFGSYGQGFRAESQGPHDTGEVVTAPAGWMTVTAAAKLLQDDLGYDLKRARSLVSKYAGHCAFKCIGTHSSRRIEPLSFDAWRLGMRDAYDEADDRFERTGKRMRKGPRR